VTGLPAGAFGRTGERITKLAFGAMEFRGALPFIGGSDIEPVQAGKVLNAVLDAGINLIDTSPDYGPSEQFIGEYISHRRSEYFLASKCGCPINPSPDDWPPRHSYTRKNVRAGVEQSLRRMKTDHLDLVQIHMSPSRAVLEQTDAVAELELLRAEGKVRFIGMSGILPDLTDHIAMGVFETFQIPYSAIEREHEDAITAAAAAGAGVIIRGGVARGLQGFSTDVVKRIPEQFRSGVVRRKALLDKLALENELDGIPRMEFLLRFTISHPGMTTTIVGTRNLAHLSDNVRAAAKGPLRPEQVEAFKRRLEAAEASLSLSEMN
jgi:aryl-alcohol dehydrogenase-like predicted oxidoreductase